MIEITRAYIRDAANFLLDKGVQNPEVGIVLGSGLNDFADRIENPIKIPYHEIPHFSVGAVDGHRGELIYGDCNGKKVIVMAGRFHYYESGDMHRTVFTTRVMIELGIKRMIITNASGCINTAWNAGEFMVISDHINMSGHNPLIDCHLSEYGDRFPDMTDTYNRDLRARLIAKAAEEEGINLREGVYVMMTGPSFETPAEIRFLRVIGADAVGMSSVPEAIIANQADLEIIGVSLLTNMAAGILDQPLTGEEINENGLAAREPFARIVEMAVAL